KEGGTLLIRRHRRLNTRNLLIVSQVAGTLTLLTLLGFQSIGIQTTLGVQQGFDPRNLYLLTLDPLRDGLSSTQSAMLLDKLLDRVKTLSSVIAAALTESVPVSMPGVPLRLLTPGIGESRPLLNAIKHVVGRAYFATTGIPILRGREFERGDEAPDAARVI